MLLTDTNILQRVCLGRAMRHVDGLRQRDIRVATTAHNIVELRRNLLNLGFANDVAADRLDWTISAFDLLMPDQYQHLQSVADARLRDGGKTDWPLLAAALATESDIWTEDVDFFGVGVPVWTTANLRFCKQD